MAKTFEELMAYAVGQGAGVEDLGKLARALTDGDYAQIGSLMTKIDNENPADGPVTIPPLKVDLTPPPPATPEPVDPYAGIPVVKFRDHPELSEAYKRKRLDAEWANIENDLAEESYQARAGVSRSEAPQAVEKAAAELDAATSQLKDMRVRLRNKLATDAEVRSAILAVAAADEKLRSVRA